MAQQDVRYYLNGLLLETERKTLRAGRLRAEMGRVQNELAGATATAVGRSKWRPR